MHWLALPEPRKERVPAFQDVPSARNWLAEQLQAQPLKMLGVLLWQIEAVDSAALPPATTLELLDLLRAAAIPLQESLAARYTRKALPMQEEDLRSFELVQQSWTWLGVAYLRLAPHSPAAAKLVVLNRAAIAFRMAEYCHFQAARECPVLLDRLLFGVLEQAEGANLLRQPLIDPDFPNLGEANIAGHLAWAFLLRLIDPYHLTSAQLVFANRALSRWRELAGFQSQPDDDPKAKTVDLGELFGAPLPDGMPRWLNVRPVIRKIRQRIVALEAGESLDALKLGRELSPGMATRLLKDIDLRLHLRHPHASAEVGEIEIAFGAEHAYSVFKQELLNPSGRMDASSATLAHDRVALFGFDRASNMPTTVKKLDVPSETWSIVDGRALRSPQQGGARRQSPCLIVSRQQGDPRLGVMQALQINATGVLIANLVWYDELAEACSLRRQSPQGQREPRVPAFLLKGEKALSVILPSSAGIRLDNGITLDGASVEHLVPVEIVERGVDFVRYACRRA